MFGENQHVPANLKSLKKPFLTALGFAGLSLLYSLGSRGKFRPGVAAAPVEEIVLTFCIVLVGAFVVFYVFGIVSTYIGFSGGRKAPNSEPSETTRGK